MTAETGGDDAIRILHVDDDPRLVELATELLHREDDRFECVTETGPHEALTRLSATTFDCVVSDYDMPGMDGLELLEVVREDHPDLPFILFTGKGSEEIASEAIAAGVTGYLQKEGNVGQYSVLANRIENAVGQRRAERRVEETQEKFRKLATHSTDVISIVDEMGRWQYLTPSSKRILGYEPEELIGGIGFDHVHPEDRVEAIKQFGRSIENPERIPSVEFRFEHPEDGWIWVENHARNMVEDPVIDGFIVHTREITERKRHAEELKRQNERLEEFTGFVSHDLRNPLDVAKGRTALASEECESDHLDEVESALSHMGSVIESALTWARTEKAIDTCEAVELSTVAERAWGIVSTRRAELRIDADGTVEADPDRLQTLLENLFRNGVEHGSTRGTATAEDVGGDSRVTVRVGTLADGLYIENDGCIPSKAREAVSDTDDATAERGVGLGLRICRGIAEAHGWEIDIDIADGDAASGANGTRIEITEVDIE
ncbi:MAG: response regulator [Halobacteriota archaeon]|uniref:response regulator n=1 Tax=Natronomonas sp. TaxID=2184060 RepID=UPI003976C062